ncbi:MAG: cell division protein FtsW [Clostridia bacterium]|nr:cell division protein FtsW [Clostridia bacterium]
MENKDNEQKAKKNKVVFFIKSKAEKINDAYEKSLADSDPVFDEPLHTDAEPPKTKVLVRGGIDVYFLLIVIALSLFGLIMAFSASSYFSYRETGDSMYYFKRHVTFVLVAVFVAVPLVMFMRPKFWRPFGIAVYLGSAVLLVAVLFIGMTGKGAQRWIDLGFITVQPSEIAKMGLIMMLAYIMSKHEKQIELNQRFGGQFRYGVLYPGIAIAVICGLVVLEKHLSGLIIIGLLGLFIMFIGGTDKRWLLLIVGVGVVAVFVVLMFSGYAQERVNTWLNIEEADPQGSAWQNLQGLYAIGSGGFFGVGLGNSRQKYGYVAEPQNDFIFTIVCEELGFIGALAVIILFLLLLYRGYKIAAKAPDKFCSLVVYGLTTKAALQALLNIAVVTNSMPNTGISLPFFSSGGTALILQIIEMGVILSISRFSYVEK